MRDLREVTWAQGSGFKGVGCRVEGVMSRPGGEGLGFKQFRATRIGFWVSDGVRGFRVWGAYFRSEGVTSRRPEIL